MYVYEFSNYFLGVNAILSVHETDIMEDSAILICELPCFSPSLQCVISHFITSCTDVNVANRISDITGSVMTYNYPTQTITLSGLNSSTSYNYCVIATNTTNMMIVGEPVCGSFTTATNIKFLRENNHNGMHIHSYISVYIYYTVVCVGRSKGTTVLYIP